MKCVGLLAGLLVLALGTGAMAQSPSPEATPEATPLYAPDDLVSVLPTHIGSVTLATRQAHFHEPPGPAQLGNLLQRHDKDIDDAKMAFAQSDRDVGIIAVTIDGVPGEVLIDGFDELVIGMDISEGRVPPLAATDWVELDGRRVLSVTVPAAESEGGVWYYPKDEVLFMVVLGDSATVTIEDVLAELP